MGDLQNLLFSKGLPLSHIDAHISHVLGRIYSSEDFRNDTCNPFLGKISPSDLKVALHESGIITPLILTPHSKDFMEGYIKYCFEMNILHSHVGEDWDCKYKGFLTRFNQIISDSKHTSSSYYARWNRLDTLDIASTYASSRDSENINWRNIISTRVLHKSKTDCYSNLDLILLEIAIKKDPKMLIEFVEDAEFFKLRGATARSSIYNRMILSGILTKKIARKIRSENSEGNSLESIKELVTHSYLYPNFGEIISQVTDTNFSSVARYLAASLPINTLAFMAGTKFDDVRNIVVDRMTKFQNGDKNV